MRQSTDYCNKIPVLPTLETLRLSVRVYQCSDRSLTSTVTGHAHCFAQKIWVRYTKGSTVNNLEVFSHHFWSWKNPSPHPNEDDFACDSIIDNITFESAMRNGQLVVKACDSRNTITTYYEPNLDNGSSADDGDKRTRTFAVTRQHRRKRPYI
jgi:hypothetical protein